MSSRLRRANRKVALWVAAFDQMLRSKNTDPFGNFKRNLECDSITRLNILANGRLKPRGAAALQVYLKRRGTITKNKE